MAKIKTILVMLTMMLAWSAGGYAQFSGSGTSNDPYMITNAAELAQLATLVNAGTAKYDTAHYKLANDIDLSLYGSGFNNGKGWIPIGTCSPSYHPFKGVFDGNSKKITGLYINDATFDYAGLFGCIAEDGIVKNLAVENVNIRGNNNVGGIIGDGVVCAITNCYTTGSVSGNDNVGGIAGYHLDGTYIGGITNCYSTCDVRGNDNVGGVVGDADDNGWVKNCYSIGKVSGKNFVSGVSGKNLDNARVEYCAALNPSVKGTGSPVGRVISMIDGIYSNIAWKGIINNAGGPIWQNKGVNDIDGEDISREAIFADSTLGGRFTSANGWTTQKGKLPGLFGKAVDMPTHLMPPSFSSGNGTSGNPYIITTAKQLADLATVVNADDTVYNDKHYKLGNDIDISAYDASFNDGKGWIPIGWYWYDGDMDIEYVHFFKGVFDGNGKKITGLYINTSVEFIGLFRCIAFATIKNLAVENVDVTGGTIVGSIVGYSQNGIVTNCYSTGKVSGDYMVGGVVGSVYNGSSLLNCYSTAEVSGDSEVGGVAGSVYIINSMLSNCYSIGKVSGNQYVGGMAGSVSNSGSLSNCAALNPSVKGTTNTFRVARGSFSGLAAVFSNNVAFDSIINKAGNVTWSNKHLDSLNGADISKQDIYADSTLGGRFTAANGWTTQKGKLPGLFGKAVDMPEHLRLPEPPTITTTSLPNGTVGVPYSAALTADGDTPIAWSFEGGNLPAGLSLSGANITGTPTIEGTFTFTVKATNNVGSAIQGLFITIGGVGIVSATLNDQLRVYPNPTKGELTIDCRDVINHVSTVEIYDVVGQRVLAPLTPLRGEESPFEGGRGMSSSSANFPLEGGLRGATIDVSHLANGMYFLKIQTENGIVVKKFIKD